MTPESRFCELLESDDLTDVEWQEMDDLSRELDAADDVTGCIEEALAELEAGLSAELH